MIDFGGRRSTERECLAGSRSRGSEFPTGWRCNTTINEDLFSPDEDAAVGACVRLGCCCCCCLGSSCAGFRPLSRVVGAAERTELAEHVAGAAAAKVWPVREDARGHHSRGRHGRRRHRPAASMGSVDTQSGTRTIILPGSACLMTARPHAQGVSLSCHSWQTLFLPLPQLRHRLSTVCADRSSGAPSHMKKNAQKHAARATEPAVARLWVPATVLPAPSTDW